MGSGPQWARGLMVDALITVLVVFGTVIPIYANPNQSKGK